MDIYVVRKGDSLWSISRRFHIDMSKLAWVNQLSDPSRLIPGMALLIPGKPNSCRRGIEVNAYAYPGVSCSILDEAMPYLTMLSPFSYELRPDGSLSSLNDEALLSAAAEGGTLPFLTVTNFTENGFSGELTHTLFNDEDVQNSFFENVLALLRQKHYCGVNFDFEYVFPFDRESYNDFLRRASSLLHSEGYYLSTAVAPKESDEQPGLLYAAHDYAAHGRYADRVIIMTYDWSYSSSAPGPVSPVDRMRDVLDYAVTVIPPCKILMGFSSYAYRWPQPWEKGKDGVAVSNSAAVQCAISCGAEISYDSIAAASHYVCYCPEGGSTVTWFEDIRSIVARLKLAEEYGLAGISIWNLNLYWRPIYRALGEMFEVEKTV